MKITERQMTGCLMFMETMARLNKAIETCPPEATEQEVAAHILATMRENTCSKGKQQSEQEART